MQQTEGTGGATVLQTIASTSRFNVEPTLTDLFDDPMTHSMMAADRVDPASLLALLRKARHSWCGSVETAP